MVGSVEYPVPEITDEEVERAVRKMKSKKAVGVSDVSIDMVKLEEKKGSDGCGKYSGKCGGQKRYQMSGQEM